MIRETYLDQASSQTSMQIEQIPGEEAAMLQMLQQYMQLSEEPQQQDESPLNTAFIADDSKIISSDHESIISEVQSLSSIPYIQHSTWASEQSCRHESESEGEDMEEPMTQGKRRREVVAAEEDELIETINSGFRKKLKLDHEVSRPRFKPATKQAKAKVYFGTIECVDNWYDDEFKKE